MHVVRGGVLEKITILVLENVPSGLKAKLDDLAKRFHEKHRQTCRKMYPSTDFCNGITNLKKLTLTERHGLVFLFVIIFLYDEGYDILDETLREKTTTTLPDVINLFEMILCFDAWIRMPTFWSRDSEAEMKVSAQDSIRNLMKLCQEYIPTVNANKWNIPKFHELLHIVDDISRFGAPMNYSADRPESLVIPAAKLPGRRAQIRSIRSAISGGDWE